MINDQTADTIQKISEAYVQVVKQSTGSNMVCMWGVIDPKSKVVGVGMSMSNALETQDMTDIYFYMQRNLFLNLFPDDE